MNEKIIYYDGRVVVLDENGKERPIVYTDNYDKILVQENVIEECENIIRCLECTSDRYIKSRLMDKLSTLYPFLMCTFFPPIILTALNYGAGISNSKVVETLLGPMTTNELIMNLSRVLIPFGGFASLLGYNNCIEKDKSEEGIQSSLIFLKAYLIIQKETLEKLKEDKNAICMEDGFKSYKVDDGSELNKLYRYRDLFYDLGYNFRRNYMYFMTRGELPKKLERTYTDEEKEIAKKYLEEKVKTLSKRSK